MQFYYTTTTQYIHLNTFTFRRCGWWYTWYCTYSVRLLVCKCVLWYSTCILYVNWICAPACLWSWLKYVFDFFYIPSWQKQLCHFFTVHNLSSSQFEFGVDDALGTATNRQEKPSREGFCNLSRMCISHSHALQPEKSVSRTVSFVGRLSSSVTHHHVGTPGEQKRAFTRQSLLDRSKLHLRK